MKTENYWKIFTNINELIRFSDTKAGILLTIYGVLLTIVYTNSANVYLALSKSFTLITFTVVLALFSLISIIFCFLTLNPKLKNPNPTSIIYFGHIQKKFSNYQKYYDSAESIITNKEFDKQIAEQIYFNSKIAWKKFTNVSWAIRFFSFSIILLIINLAIYFL